MSRRLPKRVRITEAHDNYVVGEEYEVEGVVLAAGYTFYPITRKVNEASDLIYGHKSEVIEYHEST